MRHMAIQHKHLLNNNNTRDTQTSLPNAENSVSTPLIKKDKTSNLIHLLKLGDMYKLYISIK